MDPMDHNIFFAESRYMDRWTVSQSISGKKSLHMDAHSVHFWKRKHDLRACGHATDPCNRPMAHKGTIGNPPRGPGGPLEFSDLGEIPVNPSLGGFGGKLVHPKGSWVPYKAFPSQKFPGNLVGDQSLHKIMFSGPPFCAQKGPPGLQGPRP